MQAFLLSQNCLFTMFFRTLLLVIFSGLLFSCSVPNRHIAGQENFKKDHIAKQTIPKLQYYFSANQPLVLKRVHLTGKTIEKGVIYREISDSTFYLANNTPGTLEYVYRDKSGDDIFYISFEDQFRPIPFSAKNNQKEFRIYVEGEIKTTAGNWLPAVFLRDQLGRLKEVWVVYALDKNNRLVYESGYKKKTTSIKARGKKVD